MQIESKCFPVAVLSAGTMGEGITQIAATSGHPVILYDFSQEHTQGAIENIAKRLERSVNKNYGRKVTQILANINPAQALRELVRAKLVIEAIFENLGIKQEVFFSVGITAGSRYDSSDKYIINRFEQNGQQT